MTMKSWTGFAAAALLGGLILMVAAGADGWRPAAGGQRLVHDQRGGGASASLSRKAKRDEAEAASASSRYRGTSWSDDNAQCRAVSSRTRLKHAVS
ncbi:hypothetical protein [Paenibacillus sp. B01]|uniref:hypothetical protein n=1 Tax=Paenibacillus sp. B01 TaxID=2660554 RepID=UPI00129AC96E|nr:hypothetical protein [Paenibacillus sp. B01]QGG57787.1 hypothetical protein GE073_20955 [Paenibacillus sp. B01]